MAGISKRKKAFLVGPGSSSSISGTSGAAPSSSSSSGRSSAAAAAAGIFQVPSSSSGAATGASAAASGSSRGSSASNPHAGYPMAPAMAGQPSVAGVSVYTSPDGLAPAAAPLAIGQAYSPGTAAVPHGLDAGPAPYSSWPGPAVVPMARPSSRGGVPAYAAPTLGGSWGASGRGTPLPSQGGPPPVRQPAPQQSPGGEWLPAFHQQILQHYHQPPQQQWAPAAPAPGLQARYSAPPLRHPRVPQGMPGGPPRAAVAAGVMPQVLGGSPPGVLSGPWAGFPAAPEGAVAQQQAGYGPPAQAFHLQQQQQELELLQAPLGPLGGAAGGAAGVPGVVPSPVFASLPADMLQPAAGGAHGLHGAAPEQQMPQPFILPLPRPQPPL